MSYSKWGWVAFLGSNIFLIAMAQRRKLWPFLLMQMYFGYTSINGIIRYF